MPIEIRELIIKTTIDGKSSKSKSGFQPTSEASLENNRKRILEECKNYINQKIKEEKER